MDLQQRKKIPFLYQLLIETIQILEKKLFTDKPGIELTFTNQSTVQPPPNKNQEVSHQLETQNLNNVNAMLNKHVNFENCTFNNCIFNITLCNFNKEN